MGRRFLISRLSSMGDVVCTLPVASVLKAVEPDCIVEWVVDDRFAALVDRCAAVDKTHRARPKLDPKSWLKIDGTFDIAFDMQGLSKSALIVGRAKAQSKLGYHWQRELAFLFSAPVLPAKASLHIVDQYVDVARFAVSSANVPTRFGLTPTEEDIAAALALRGDEARPIAIINPGAAWATKRWPLENVVQLTDALSGAGFAPALIGGPSAAELEVGKTIVGAAKSRVANWIGKTNLGSLVGAIAQAALHIGGDTGTSHIAAALGIPAIGLYSITRPERSCPYGQRNRCLYDSQSLANITVEMVLEQALRVAA